MFDPMAAAALSQDSREGKGRNGQSFTIYGYRGIGIKDWPTRLWYMEHAFEEGWSHDWLVAQIKRRAHERQARAVTNFADRLPLPASALAQDALKDPYIFDFLTLEEPSRKRD